MPAGYKVRMRDTQYPLAYCQATAVDKPLEAIWADINQHTCEIGLDEPYFFHNLDFSVLIPPLEYEGVFLKGLYFSQAVDVLHAKFPRLPRIFHAIANSMWTSCPWSETADAYFLAYPNEARLAFERRRRPELGLLLPFQDGDLTNEYICTPTPNATRDVDLLCVASLAACKNMPIVFEAVRLYRERHAPITLTWVVGSEDLQGVEVPAFVTVIPRLDYLELIKLYGRARAVVLGSLIEGKNRSLFEAMCCDTPVVAFKAYNQFTRGPEAPIPEGAGELAEFGPEGLAAAIHEVRTGSYRPRRRYLEWKGRKASFNRLVDHIPYYRETLPGYEPGNAAGNLWLDLACMHHYGLGFHDFLYERQNGLSRPLGLERLTQTVDYYLYKFVHHTRG